MPTSRISHLLLSILSLSFFATFLASGQTENKNPFATKSEPIIPRMAHPALFSKHLSPRITNPKALEETSSFEIPIETLPDYPTKLTALSLVTDKINPNDKIYNISSRFPNIKKGDQQWVHYNATKERITANANAYLRTSIREYVQRIEMNLPLRLKISVLSIETDTKTNSGIKNLKTLISNKSDLVHILKDFTLETEDDGNPVTDGDKENNIFITPWVAEDRSSISMVISINKGVTHSTTVTDMIAPNRDTVIDCGFTPAGKRHLLIVNPELQSMSGRRLKTIKSAPCVMYLDPIYISENDDPFQSDNHKISRYKVDYYFPIILQPKSLELTVTPSSRYYDKNDIVYDMTKVFKEEGILLTKPVFFNQTQTELITEVTGNELRMLESLLNNIRCGGIPRTLKTKALFYEVDSKNPTDQNWSLDSILLSNPKPLYRAAFINLLGENSEARSRIGQLALEASVEDDGIHVSHDWEIKINYKGTKINKNLDLQLPKNGTTIIDLKDLGNGRSIIMVIETKEEPFYKIEDRFGKER